MGSGEATPAANQLNSRFLKKVDVQGIEAIHLGTHPLQQVADVGILQECWPVGGCIPS